MTPRGSEPRKKALWRKAAAWGAQKGPRWFVRAAPFIIGLFFAIVSSQARRAVRRNQRRVHGRQPWTVEARAIIQTFVQFAYAFTASLAPQRPLFRDRPVRVLGKELIDPFVEQGQGILFVTAHVGPWDLAAMKLRGMVNRPVLMLMSGEASREGADVQDAVREDEQVRVLRVGTSPLDALPLFEHLKAGGIVVSQVDRVPPGAPHIETSLFGGPFRVPLGLFRLAGALGCPLVPVLSARDGTVGDTVRVTEPLTVASRPSNEELKAAAQTVTSRLGDHLRAYSTQWFHFVEL